uniref:Uncharacterized protein n=1 Tax=Arundo donax TaxID=35708 RepID=A0A0A9B9S2_ARUDO
MAYTIVLHKMCPFPPNFDTFKRSIACVLWKCVFSLFVYIVTSYHLFSSCVHVTTLSNFSCKLTAQYSLVLFWLVRT